MCIRDRSWWGKAWNKNLESYADYANRISRGKSYVRNHAVLDLQIREGSVEALVPVSYTHLDVYKRQIPGVKEDVTEVIMNIKSLAIKNNSDTNEPKVAYIEFEGEGVVTAADIQVDPDIEIMNPDLVIATLNGGADSKLYMELTITKGRGYVSADKNKDERCV